MKRARTLFAPFLVFILLVCGHWSPGHAQQFSFDTATQDENQGSDEKTKKLLESPLHPTMEQVIAAYGSFA